MSTERGSAPPGRHGRRSAVRRPRGVGQAVLALALLLGAVAAVLAPKTPPRVEADRPDPGQPVRHGLLSCPALPAPEGGGSRTVLGTRPGNGLGDGGTLRRHALETPAEPVELRRGALTRVPDGAAQAVRAEGAVAAGLFGFRVDRGTRTLAVTRCREPRASWWFTGAGAGLDHTSELVMVNVDQGPAVVDVRVLGLHGEVETVGTRGITIAPGTRERIPLTRIAPQSDDLAVAVRAHRGRVVAAVRDSFARRAGAAPGDEWLPADDRPSRTVRLAGLPDRAGTRTLLLGNPSDLEAVVSVRAAGRHGPFVPAGLGELRVPPGTVRRVDLADALEQVPGPVLLRLRSHVPVVATVRATKGRDSAYAAAVRPLVAPAVAPVAEGTSTTVQLTAGSLPATARVTAYDADGHEVAGTELSLSARATTSWRPGRRKAAYVVVRPGTGDVSGAVRYGRRGVSVVPLVSLPVRFRKPVVAPGYSGS